MIPYQYPIRGQRIVRDKLGARLDRRVSDEGFIGVVQGLKASDLEERFSRSLAKLEYPFEFRYRISSPLTGTQRLTRQFLNETGEVEIDFLVYTSGIIPVFIDGEIGHFFTPYQADKDADKTNVTNDFGARAGWFPAVRIPYWRLQDQEMSDRTVRETFGNEWYITTTNTFTVDAGHITNSGSGYEWTAPGNVTFTNTRLLRQKKYLEKIRQYNMVPIPSPSTPPSPEKPKEQQKKKIKPLQTPKPPLKTPTRGTSKPTRKIK